MSDHDELVARAERTQEFVAYRDPDGQIMLDLIRDLTAALKECRERVAARDEQIIRLREQDDKSFFKRNEDTALLRESFEALDYFYGNDRARVVASKIKERLK